MIAFPLFREIKKTFCEGAVEATPKGEKNFPLVEEGGGAPFV